MPKGGVFVGPVTGFETGAWVCGDTHATNANAATQSHDQPNARQATAKALRQTLQEQRVRRRPKGAPILSGQKARMVEGIIDILSDTNGAVT